jgi:hypothetical protein
MALVKYISVDNSLVILFISLLILLASTERRLGATLKIATGTEYYYKIVLKEKATCRCHRIKLKGLSHEN